VRDRDGGDEAPALRIVFLDSWHTDRARGSGSTVAIAGLEDGLRALGHRVARARPRVHLPSLDLTRIAFNLEIGTRPLLSSADLIVGFDFDGCFLPHRLLPRYVVSLKGVSADERKHERGWNAVRFHLLTALERRNARRARRVFVTSEHSAAVASAAYGLPAERLRVVPEGIDVDAWSAVSRPTREVEESPVLLSVARQYRRKNTETLLRAMPSVRRAVPGVQLRVIGDGPELPRLRALATSLGIDDCVSLPGSLAGIEAVQRELAAAHVFCLPSRQEGFGIVFLEAMAAGLPIVAGRAGAVPEVAPEGEVSILVPPDNVDRVAEAIVRLLRDRHMRRRLGEAGRRRCRRYAWPDVARQFLAGVERT
jgi:glycosyltransferase involved in cell wall biosynthesis